MRGNRVRLVIKPLTPIREMRIPMKSSRSTRPDGLLRGDAEAELKHTPRAEVPARSADELLHELQVHQIELEIQNETLRQAQDALEESRDRYVDLYEFAPVAYLTLSATGRIEAINLTGATLLGIERESFLHNRFTRFVASEDRDRWQRHFLYTLLHGGKSICELSIQRGDDTVFDASVDCLLAAESGSAPTLRITLSDITVYKQALAKMRSSESRYSTLFENMPDGLAHCRMIFREEIPIDYEFVAANPAFEKVSGLSHVIGRKISEIIPDYARDNPIALEAFARVVRTGEPARWEQYLTAVDRWLLFAAYRPAHGEFVAVIENTSERKRADDELRKLSLAVKQSPVSIVITDLTGRIEYVNPGFSLTSGFSAAEALGQNPRLLKSGRTPPETYDELWATLVAGKVWRGEFINRRKDGSEYYESATLSPVCQADGRVTHFVGVKIDISELKQTMAKLWLSEERLRLVKTATGLGIFDWISPTERSSGMSGRGNFAASVQTSRLPWPRSSSASLPMIARPCKPPLIRRSTPLAPVNTMSNIVSSAASTAVNDRSRPTAGPFSKAVVPSGLSVRCKTFRSRSDWKVSCRRGAAQWKRLSISRSLRKRLPPSPTN